MFDETVFLAGVVFTGLGWIAPRETFERVPAIAVPSDYDFSKILNNFGSGSEGDITQYYIEQSEIAIDGVQYKRFVAVDSLDWWFANTGPNNMGLEV